jgi:hypothetical protein
LLGKPYGIKWRTCCGMCVKTYKWNRRFDHV